MREEVNARQEKYVVALLFDISGAFDNLWWPSILPSLKQRGCPRNLYRLIASYLSNRKVQITGRHAEAWKQASNGCPQGSILGPSFWYLIFDDLINKLEALGYIVIAYADDLIVLIPGNSRIHIEEAANKVTKVILEWCRKQKLKLSDTKTEMLLEKGFMDIRRPPTVKIEQKSLKMVPTAKYLGVKFGTRLNITPHIEYIVNKTKIIFNKLAHVARAHWGINQKSMSTLYKGIFIPIITYAAAG